MVLIIALLTIFWYYSVMNRFRENNPEGEIQQSQFKAGDKVRIGDKEFEIESVETAAELGEKYGLKINRDIPVYHVKGTSPGRQGAYHPETDSVWLFENMTDEDTIKHELVHVVEYNKEKSPELIKFYERAKSKISEDSFESNLVTFNFNKNIHEFIADGHAKKAFIEALKKEGLYEEFLQLTGDLFEN
ncbi:MAG: hypothetical protein KW802_03145 [Candidatus Doudnabacteria bacterium]|nr:hypothetical protein [Candidatus Doudnabacteria bacterium]